MITLACVSQWHSGEPGFGAGVTQEAGGREDVGISMVALHLTPLLPLLVWTTHYSAMRHAGSSIWERALRSCTNEKDAFITRDKFNMDLRFHFLCYTCTVALPHVFLPNISGLLYPCLTVMMNQLIWLLRGLFDEWKSNYAEQLLIQIQLTAHQQTPLKFN